MQVLRKQTLTKERWRPVIGYDGLYEVSDMSRIRGLDRISYHKGNPNHPRKVVTKILKQWIDKKGYSHVTLCKDGIKKRHSIHIETMLSFVGKPQEREEILHLEHAKINNNHNLSNLRYGSKKCNAAFKIDDGTNNEGAANANAKITDSDVLNIRKMYKTGKYSYRRLGFIFSVHYTNIYHIVKRKSWAWL